MHRYNQYCIKGTWIKDPFAVHQLKKRDNEISELKAELKLVKECEKNSVQIADDAMAEVAEYRKFKVTLQQEIVRLKLLMEASDESR